MQFAGFLAYHYSSLPTGNRTSRLDSPSLGGGARTGLGGATILLVEDDADTAALLRLVLEDAGARVQCAATAREACSLLRAVLPLVGQTEAAQAASGPIDLIVLDVRLRDGDGSVALAQLRSAGHVLPPVVIVSAASRRDVEEAAHRLGAFGVVYKPFELRTLLACIEQALQRHL